MNKDGYTLVEMLAALIMISLAIGGLLQGMRVIGRIQDSAGRSVMATREQRTAQEGLDRLVASQGPFFSDDLQGFTGSLTQFSFDCGRNVTCGARLTPQNGLTRLDIVRDGVTRFSATLPRGGPAGFTYVGERTTGSAWPPLTTRSERLNKVMLTLQRLDGLVPVASVRLWLEQKRTCQFDAIAQACRNVSQ
jgi:prepilin-type N-terminal cleavage/methylation domain-containing protein